VKPVGSGRFSLQRVRSGGALILGRLAKFVGSSFLEDIAAFLTDFQLVLGGFQERAQSIGLLMRQPHVAFLLVLGPEVSAVDEAIYFASRLSAAGVPLAAFVVNRVHSRPGVIDADEMASRLRACPETAGLAPADIDIAAERLARTGVDFRKLTDSERRELARLSTAAAGIPVWEVPQLGPDVGSLAALRAVGDHLGMPRP
jgi:anion-transporting  ArsA/GET3 family ATPase